MSGVSRQRALLAKGAAENNIRSLDYTRARRQILRAMEIFPALDNAVGMLSVCDVLCASSMDLPTCGINWYWIMQLFPTVDGPTIRGRYQNLTSLLGRIKGSFPGTETALEFVHEAYSVLSDPIQRSAFDLKRNGGAQGSGVSESQVECVEGNENVAVDAVDERIPMDGASQSPASSGLKKYVNEGCESQYNIVETHPDDKEKQDLCNEASFSASQAAREADMSINTCLGPFSGYYEFGKDRKSDKFSVGQVWAAFDTEKMPRSYALTNKSVQQDNTKKLSISQLTPHPSSLHKHRLNVGLPVGCESFMLESNKITMSGQEIFSHLFSKTVTSEPFEIFPQKGEVWAVYRDLNNEWLFDPGMRKDCGFEVVEVLTDYTKDTGVGVAYLTKVDGYKNIFQQNKRGGKESSFHIPAEKLFLFSHRVPLFRFKGGEVDGHASGMLELDPSGMPNYVNRDFSFPFITSTPSTEAKIDCPSILPAVTTSNTSLKTGLQNYKTKWSCKDFKKEEIWAFYSGPDAMPRLYVKIVNVISENFANVSFLEPCPILDDEMQWVKEGMPFVCGIFKEGNLISTMNVNKFSHPVEHDHSTAKPFYKIFPQKGEVWAMYRKRNVVNWKDGYPRKHDYRIVEIVSDSCDKSGVNICCLIEVKGYMTIFQRQLHDNFQLMRHISRQEMLSFSHRIPAFTMVGVNNKDIPRDSWHLQPDSLPPNSS